MTAAGEGLRIGELARFAGVSTRTVRHYHRIGVLPEPARRPNGYRLYGSRDVVRLLRVRRLVELGLTLDETADVLADDEGREIHDILLELDADLAAQQQRIGERRERIAELLRRSGDPSRSVELVGLLDELAQVAGDQHPGLERERLIVEMLESAGSEAADVFAGYHRLLADPRLAGPAMAAYQRFEELASADPHDPAVDELASQVVGLGPGIRDLLPTPGTPAVVEPAGADRAALVLRAVQADLTSAQRRCLELIFTGLAELS